MIDFNFKYSNVFSRADVAAYKALDGSIYITVAIHPFDGRDSVIRCCARYLPGEGRRAAMDFQAIVTDADMLALCRVNPALRKSDLHPALEEDAFLLDRDFAEAFDYEEE